MTWYEQRKCKEFLKNPQEHFEKTNIVNFDIINKQIRSEKNFRQTFERIPNCSRKKVSQYPKKERQNILSCAFRTNRSDIYFETKKSA